MSVSITSKTPGISGEDWMHYCFFGDTINLNYSGFNFINTSSENTIYVLNSNNKKVIYNKVKGIDTLFDKTNDTTKSYDEKDEKFTTNIDSLVNGYKCLKSVIVSDNKKEERVYLDTTVYENGKLITLNYTEENPFYILSEKVISISEEDIDKKIFELPNLPIRKWNPNSVCVYPNFEGSVKEWTNYLSENLRGNLGRRYIKIPEGDTTAKETVNVYFAIDKHGSIAKTVALNAKYIHPKLVKEALRVLNESPLWFPGTFNGKEIPFIFKQNIIFQVKVE